MSITQAWILVIILMAIKHFLADFVLQDRYMLGKFLPPPKCIMPLSAHCLVHVMLLICVFIIVLICGFITDGVNFAIKYIWVVDMIFAALVYEFVTHFMVDLTKAQLTRIYKWTPQDSVFWVAIGVDQMMHTLLSIPLIYFIVEVVILS